MPLTPYKRGNVYWARGWIELEGRPIAGPYRQTTYSLTEAGARDWINIETEKQKRRHIVGDEYCMDFAEALSHYPIPAKDARRYLLLLDELGPYPLNKITGALLKDLARRLKPNVCADTWWREIITPARAVINYAHEQHGTPMIKVSGFDSQERMAQDRKRGRPSRITRTPSTRAWVEAFCAHADPYNAALLRFMFETAARIDQATSIRPRDLHPSQPKVRLKAQKGHIECWVTVSDEMMAEMRALRPKCPRNRKLGTLQEARVFGYGSPTGYAKRWQTICKKADIQYLSAHAAGRHGFYTHLVVHEGVDPATAAAAGRWADVSLPMRIYAHAKTDEEQQIRARFRTKPVQTPDSVHANILG
ncbi:tyrosine-type recombinase/integrase [Thioclava sp. GXIMD4215]|uniref:tyrosine-type recombinase/integrase n=1 Tax=Thioclava sp. GXIMD4215 TaxID=3131928 RepID=UPI003251A4A5